MMHKDYLQQNPEYLRMQSDLSTRLRIDPVVAAYALFYTNFSNVAMAMDFIYEKQEGEGSNQPLMQHKFVGCLPKTPEFMQVGSQNIGYLDDIEKGKAALAQQEECYICH